MNPTENITRSWVFRLIILNSLIYVLSSNFVELIGIAGLYPYQVFPGLKIWQFVTYMFLHGDFYHILFNMYGLFIFGLAVEEVWGSKKFILYYMFCGVGAGLVIFLIGFFQGVGFPTIGASGAIFGILLAFGYLFPEAEILLFFFIPMKARTMVIVFGALSLGMELSGGMGSVSHVGHLGGLLFGLIYIFIIDRRYSKARRIFLKVKKTTAATLGVKEVVLEKTIESVEQNKLKVSILEKLNGGGGAESLTDDEYQLIRYIDIVTESGAVFSKDEKSLTEEQLNDRKFLETVKKFISV